MRIPPRLRWHRSEFGTYADSPLEDHRYYVFKDGGSWTLEVVATTETAGVTHAKPGTLPKVTDQFNPTAKLAKAVAAAYDTQPDRSEWAATNRITRAIEIAYRGETP